MNKIQLDQSLLGLEQYNLKDNLADQVKIFCYSLIMWVSLFCVVNTYVSIKGVSKKNLDDIKNRIVSIIHGLVMFFLSGYSLTIEQSKLDSPNTNFQHFIFLLSAAYFVYDFIACFYYRLASFGISLHHILVTSAYLSSMNAQYGGTESMYALFFGEISNCPMNAKDCLRAMNLKYTKIHEFLENLFVSKIQTLLTYLQFYTLLQEVYLYLALLFTAYNPKISLFYQKQLVLDCFYYQSFIYSLITQYLIFFFLMQSIIQGVKRRGKYSKERKQKDIHYFWFSENPLVQSLSYYRSSSENQN